MNTVPQPTATVKTVVQFADDTYATIDPAYSLCTLHRGKCDGDDSWGGQVIASMELDKLIQLATIAIGGDRYHAAWVLQGQPLPEWSANLHEAYAGALPAEWRADYIGD